MPNPTSNVTATAVSPTSIQLNWQSNGGNVVGFKVLRYDNASKQFVQVAFMGPAASTYTDSGLTPGTSYAYYVIATNNAGGDAWGSTNQANATTPAAAPAMPNPTSNVTATAVSPTSIQLNWQSNGGNVVGFKVLRYDNASKQFVQVAFMGPAASTYTDSGLTPGTSYAYYVIATNNAGGDAWGSTNQANATTPAAAPAMPNPTSNVTATAVSPTSIQLNWQSNGGNVVGFKVLRYDNASKQFVQVAFMGPAASTYTDSGLTPGTSYAYYVIATNNAGGDAWGSTNQANATTPTGLPAVGRVSSYAGVSLGGLQCVPAARNLSVALNHGLGFPYLGTNGVAADLWNMNLAGFTKVAYQPGLNPPRNSLLIWKPTSSNGNAGHIAFVLGTPSAGTVRVVDSNWGLDQQGQIHDVQLSISMFGWFVPNS